MMKVRVGEGGRVTLPSAMLRHLRIGQGEKVELSLLPNAQVLLRKARSSGSIDDFIGLLKGKRRKIASLKEIREATLRGWVGQQ